MKNLWTKMEAENISAKKKKKVPLPPEIPE